MMNEDKALTTSVDYEGWDALINALAEEAGDTIQERDKILKAAEYLVLGYPVQAVAKELGVKQATVKDWISSYPSLAYIIANGRKLMFDWRMRQLDKQVLLALDFSDRLMRMSAAGDDVDSKLLGIQAQQARYILDTFVKNHQADEIQISQKGSNVSLDGSAMGVLLSKLEQLVEEKGPVPVILEIDDNRENEQPMLDPMGNPFYGKMRVIDVNEDGIECHICGSRTKYFETHVKTRHDIPLDIYAHYFMLDERDIKEVEKEYAKRG